MPHAELARFERPPGTTPMTQLLIGTCKRP